MGGKAIAITNRSDGFVCCGAKRGTRLVTEMRGQSETGYLRGEPRTKKISPSVQNSSVSHLLHKLDLKIAPLGPKIGPFFFQIYL